MKRKSGGGENGNSLPLFSSEVDVCHIDKLKFYNIIRVDRECVYPYYQ